MNTKKCSRCKTNKNLTEFNKNKSNLDGLQYACRECQRAINRKHYSENKEAQAKRVRKNAALSRQRLYNFLLKYYNNCPQCEICGESDTRCLQFHHKDPLLKDSSISNLLRDGCGITKLKKELDKCILLCANCHCKEHNTTQWHTKGSYSCHYDNKI